MLVRRSSRWSWAGLSAWKVALRVSVSPALSERVIGLCNAVHVSLDVGLECAQIQSIYSSLVFLTLRDIKRSITLNQIKHLYWRNVC